MPSSACAPYANKQKNHLEISGHPRVVLGFVYLCVDRIRFSPGIGEGKIIYYDSVDYISAFARLECLLQGYAYE